MHKQTINVNLMTIFIYYYSTKPEKNERKEERKRRKKAYSHDTDNYVLSLLLMLRASLIPPKVFCRINHLIWTE